MLLNLDDLGLRAGQRHDTVYGMDIAPITFGGAEFVAVVPEGVHVIVERIAGGHLLRLDMTAKVFGPCSRCLAEVCRELHAEQEEFIPSADGGWADSESVSSPFVEGMVVDLTGLSREAVVLALPDRVLCSEDCRGLCSTCGAELNKGGCACPPLEV